MKRVRLIIFGDVVGVGFRAWALRVTKGLSLVGWVTNKQDDTVEIVAEGTREHLEDFLAQCRRGPELAVVKDVDVKWEDATNEFVSFEVVY